MAINKNNICLKCSKNNKTIISSSIKLNDTRDS